MGDPHARFTCTRMKSSTSSALAVTARFNRPCMPWPEIAHAYVLDAKLRTPNQKIKKFND